MFGGHAPLPFLYITLGCHHWSQAPSLNYFNLPGLLYPYTLSHYTLVPPPPHIYLIYLPDVTHLLGGEYGHANLANIHIIALSSKSYTVHTCILAERKTQNENDEFMESASTCLTDFLKLPF